MKEINDLKDKIKKLKKEKAEMEKENTDLKKKLGDIKDENLKVHLIQSKETTNLKKQKEKINKKNKELKEEIQGLNQKISALEHQLLNQRPQSQNATDSNNANQGYTGMIYPKSKNNSKRSSGKGPNHTSSQVGQSNAAYNPNETYEKIKKEEEKKIIPPKGGDKLLLDLVHFCMARNIDIKRHLKSYYPSDNGRISDEKFMNAIMELKTSFTENDIKELLQFCKPKNGDDISIDEFVELLKSKDSNYKVKDETVVSSDDKQFSKKYDMFDNKPYNMNYP